MATLIRNTVSSPLINGSTNTIYSQINAANMGMNSSAVTHSTNNPVVNFGPLQGGFTHGWTSPYTSIANTNTWAVDWGPQQPAHQQIFGHSGGMNVYDWNNPYIGESRSSSSVVDIWAIGRGSGADSSFQQMPLAMNWQALGQPSNVSRVMGGSIGPGGSMVKFDTLGRPTGGLNSWDGPFLNSRVNMGGQVQMISISDPRHTSHAYQDRYPDLFNQYQSGFLSGSQLFNQAMLRSVNFDFAEPGNFSWSPSLPPNVRVSFNASGGGRVTGLVSW